MGIKGRRRVNEDKICLSEARRTTFPSPRRLTPHCQLFLLLALPPSPSHLPPPLPPADDQIPPCLPPSLPSSLVKPTSLFPALLFPLLPSLSPSLSLSLSPLITWSICSHYSLHLPPHLSTLFPLSLSLSLAMVIFFYPLSSLTSFFAAFPPALSGCAACNNPFNMFTLHSPSIHRLQSHYTFLSSLLYLHSSLLSLYLLPPPP